jgi:glycosyltransferase involved in cell wall biosynthesis
VNRISIFCPITLPYKSGAGLNAFNLAKAFSKQGYYTEIVSFNQGQDIKQETIEGIKICRINWWNKNKFSKILSYLIIVPAFVKHMFRSDLTIIFGPVQGYFILILLGKLFNRKVVFRSTMYGKDDLSTLNNKFGPILYSCRKWILSKMGGYISQSPAMSSSFRLEFHNKIPILESAQGVNTEVFFSVTNELKDEIRKKLDLPLYKKIIISVGYVIERKGYREIFEALASLKDESNYLYIVIGNYSPIKGHYMYYLKDEMTNIHDYGIKLLSEKIRFIGESNEIQNYLQASDIFILNSVMEGMPNVLLEAMACGLPSVVKSMHGVDEYITQDKKNAFIVNNSQDIADRIKKLLSDDNLLQELGQNASQFIGSNFSLSKVSLDIINKFKT